MKKALIPAILLSLSILSACSVVVPEESENSEQQTAEAAFSVKQFSSGKSRKKVRDATSFLVGEYYVNNGFTACFDGRGSVTMVSPEGDKAGGYYAMEEGDRKHATVHINMGEGETKYTYNLISSEGDFTLSNGSSSLLVFVLKAYE